MGKRFKRFNRGNLRLLPLSERQNKIKIADFFQLNDLFTSYPGHFDAPLGKLVQQISDAKENKKQVIWMMGAHPLRRGNSRFIIDLMERGIITHLASNMACAIHDFEMSLIGETCEDVELYVKDGKFGNWKETGSAMNKAALFAYKKGIGLGESIGQMIENKMWQLEFKYPEISIFAAAYRLGIPATIHKGIGCDITDQYSLADFAALGWASGHDFLVFAHSISKLDGGVFLNIGTQVTGPEVYLKALSMARNVATQKGKEIRNFTTAVFDVVDLGDWKSDGCDWRKQENYSDPGYFFRPKKTILVRTVKDGGESFYIKGDFRVTIPNLYHSIISKQKEEK